MSQGQGVIACSVMAILLLLVPIPSYKVGEFLQGIFRKVVLFIVYSKINRHSYIVFVETALFTWLSNMAELWHVNIIIFSETSNSFMSSAIWVNKR